ncbi:MAG: class I SAM-dependent methyltransferase [Betaproteobacteria bacterium]
MTDDCEKAELYTRFKGWSSDGFGRYKKHWARYYRNEIQACESTQAGESRRQLRLLEIGFGNGSFLGWARDQGHTIYGIEIDAPQLAAAQRAGFQARGSLSELDAAYDIDGLDGVVAFDVFEHLSSSQLIELLQGVHRLLKPGGWVLARFPNGDSPFGRLNQHGDLTHVTTLGSTALRQLALASNLQLLYVGSPQTPVLRIGLAHGVATIVSIVTRWLLELPLQLLLNAYYPGSFPRFYPLSPNLVARLARLGTDSGNVAVPEGSVAKTTR